MCVRTGPRPRGGDGGEGGAGGGGEGGASGSEVVVEVAAWFTVAALVVAARIIDVDVRLLLWTERVAPEVAEGEAQAVERSAHRVLGVEDGIGAEQDCRSVLAGHADAPLDRVADELLLSVVGTAAEPLSGRVVRGHETNPRPVALVHGEALAAHASGEHADVDRAVLIGHRHRRRREELHHLRADQRPPVEQAIRDVQVELGGACEPHRTHRDAVPVLEADQRRLVHAERGEHLGTCVQWEVAQRERRPVAGDLAPDGVVRHAPLPEHPARPGVGAQQHAGLREQREHDHVCVELLRDAVHERAARAAVDLHARNVRRRRPRSDRLPFALGQAWVADDQHHLPTTHCAERYGGMPAPAQADAVLRVDHRDRATVECGPSGQPAGQVEEWIDAPCSAHEHSLAAIVGHLQREHRIDARSCQSIACDASPGERVSWERVRGGKPICASSSKIHDAQDVSALAAACLSANCKTPACYGSRPLVAGLSPLAAMTGPVRPRDGRSPRPHARDTPAGTRDDRFQGMGTMGTISAAFSGIAAMPVTPANTGLVVGAAAFAWSLRPSLLPRDQATQTTVSLGSFGLGFAVGAGLNHVLKGGVSVATHHGGGAAAAAAEGAAAAAPAARAAARTVTFGRLGIIGVGAGLGLMALPLARHRDFPFANTVESAGRVMLAAGVGSLGVQVHKYAISRLASTPTQKVALNGALVALELLGVGSLLSRRRSHFAKDDPTTPTGKTALIAGLTVGGTYLAVMGEMSMARRIVSKVTGTSNWHVHAGIAALAGAAGVGWMLWKNTHKEATKPLRLDDPLPTVHGPDPSDPSATLDEAGIRFLQGAMPKEKIAEVTGRDGAIDPIRVAVGYHSFGSVHERATVALDRLKASGAYDRSMIFVAASPGAGTIDDRLPGAVELLANGDVASVAVPYSDRASFLSLNRIQDGADTYRQILTGIKAENDARAARGEPVPKVVLYGNSLGSWSTQEIFNGRGVQAVEELVDRTLWVGNPGPSGWRNKTLFPGRGEAKDPLRDHVLEFSDVSELDGLTQAQRDRTRIWMHTRGSDPVSKVDVDMLWRRPLFLQAEHKDQSRMPKNAAFIPGVSVLQELGDVLTTSRIADDPDRQRDGHTYRVDIVPDVASAFFPGVTDRALVDRVEAAVTAQERQLNRVRAAQRRGE